MGTIALVVGMALAGVPATPDAQRPDRTALQAAVDDFSALDLSGERASMRDWGGRVVLLEFWATWCAPCLADIPWLQTARRRHGGRLEIVGVSLDVIDRAAFVSWLRRHGIEWRQVYDGRGWSSPTIAPFTLDAIPFNVLVGADGRVIGVDVRGETLLRTLDVLLQDRARHLEPPSSTTR
ncbi:hypothetical protein BH23ACI1_BH23ACI1_26030 [soil metagenome]